MKYIYELIVVFIAVYLIIPYMIKLAVKFDFVDKPTERKKHKENIPLLGGVGMFLGFLIGIVVFLRPFDTKLFYILSGGVLILLIGLIDDYYKTKEKEFGVSIRLIVQIIAAYLAYKGGAVFTGFTNPINHVYVTLPVWLQLALTLIWILGVTTVINWCDGMDGLAGSLAVISAGTLFIVALVKNQSYSASLSVMTMAAALGFLIYNKYPAKIFMGDSGANFLGYILGIIALDGAFKQTTIVSIFIPILALGVPIFDNIFVIFKRMLSGKPVYKADRSQIHYRLLSKGLSQTQVVAVICTVSICLSLCSILMLMINV